jgi:2-phospho-L-lactate guanylyltransferase
MPDVSSDGDQWSLIVPVKRLDIAKSRLRLSAAARADLALAMAIDTVGVALLCDGVGEVIVVTDDQRARTALSGIGAQVAGDAPDAGLNPALRHGASLAQQSRRAAMSSDLPALRVDDLAAILNAAGAFPRAIVADALGTGSTLLTARTPRDFRPAFGADSRAAHVNAGATDLTGQAGTSLRHDVDTLDGLRSAVRLGVGAATMRALADHRLTVEHESD